MMKLRSALALALALAFASPAAAQETRGTTPLSGAKGGTNNSFMQFTGPTTAIKTYTLPNFSDTIDTITAANTLTNKTLTSPAETNTTVTGSFTATGLVTYADLASAALATAAQFIAGTANTVVPASVMYTAETTTTFGATTTFDFSTFIDTAVTLTGNITTMTLTNIKAGQAGTIAFIQDGTGGRTTVWNSNFKFAGGVTPSLTTATPNAVDVLSYSCRSATFCVASLLLNVH